VTPLQFLLDVMRDPKAPTDLRIASRLSRTFAILVEALRRLRSGGSQTIRIERVDVRDGGQAIIGNVKQEGRRRRMSLQSGAAAGGVSDNADWSKSAPATPSAGGPKATFRSRIIP
jgi:hypothetical protein